MAAVLPRACAICFVLCASPALWLAGAWATAGLGPNPLDRLLHVSGRVALLLLLVTLAVSPLRRLSVQLARAVHAHTGKRLADWNWLIRLRRMLGLFTFFYALLHMGLYAVLDAGLSWAALRDDLAERPFIGVGWIGLVLLAPLAATSTNAAMRALGVWWRRLHLLAYAAAVLGLAHYAMQARLVQDAPWPEAAALLLLLAGRLRAWWRGERLPAGEVQRPARAPAGGAAPSGTSPGAALPARPRRASSR
jgi:methionine sulfoxide reductase heme-binding subunit